MKRFACQDVIPGCDQVFTGADDQSVLDQVIAHAAMDHGLVKPPLALVELVVATTHTFVPPRQRGHLRLVSDGETDPPSAQSPTEDGADAGHDSGDDQPSAEPEPGRSAVVTMASDRFRRESESGDRTTVEFTVVDHDSAGPVTLEGYRHECVMYGGLDDFLATVVPFLEAGIELNQPILVAVIEPRLSAIRQALGDAADRVEFVDMAELGRNPARIIPAWRDFAARSGGRPMRGLGEPIWAGRRAAEVVESQLHEALLNIAVDQHTPLWLLCPYDVDALDPAVVAEARRTHPFVGGGDNDIPDNDIHHKDIHHKDIARKDIARKDIADNECPDDESPQADADLVRPGFGGTAHLQALFAANLPQPTVQTASLLAADPSALAGGVLDFAAAAGLATQRSTKLATAIGEIAAAGNLESGAAVSVRIWRDESALVCEVGDTGHVSDPMIGRGSGFSAQSRDRGIRLANELCDLVQVRSGANGTTVRVHSWL